MKDKIWSEHDLQKRDGVAAEASKLIESSEHTRTMAQHLMPNLIKFEILPNIDLDSLTDDDIRQLAISPPRRLSKAANFDYYNKFPRLPLETCFMLYINVEPGTPIRTQSEKDAYEEIVLLALSYGRAHKQPFENWRVGKFGKFEIEPAKFIKWLESNDYVVPEDWQPCLLDERRTKPDMQDVTTAARWIFRRAPGNNWEVGHESRSVVINGGKGAEDFAVAVRTPDCDCLKVIIGSDPAENIPTYGSDDMMDSETTAQVKKSVAEIKESLELARNEGESDLVDEYEDELKRLTDYLKKSSRPGLKPKRLDSGDPMKSITNRLRNRKRTLIQTIRKAGFDDIANHVRDQFKVADRSVIY